MKDVAGGLILLLALAAGVLWLAWPTRTCSPAAMRRGREANARHLISQLELAADQYEKANRLYPPGDGKGSRGLVEVLSTRPPERKSPFFEFDPAMLRDGHVLNPIDPEAPGDAGILHYARPSNGARPRFWFHTDRGTRVTNED